MCDYENENRILRRGGSPSCPDGCAPLTGCGHSVGVPASVGEERESSGRALFNVVKFRFANIDFRIHAITMRPVYELQGKMTLFAAADPCVSSGGRRESNEPAGRVSRERIVCNNVVLGAARLFSGPSVPGDPDPFSASPRLRARCHPLQRNSL